jgi:hypothetical protein
MNPQQPLLGQRMPLMYPSRIHATLFGLLLCEKEGRRRFAMASLREVAREVTRLAVALPVLGAGV